MGVKYQLFGAICLIAVAVCVNVACNNIDPELIVEDQMIDHTNEDKELCVDDFPTEYRQKCDVQQRLAIMKAMENSWEHFERENRNGMIFCAAADSVSRVYDLYMQENLTIHNALTDEPVINCYDPNNEADRNKFALFTVQHQARERYLLILNRGEFTAIYAHVVELDDCLQRLMTLFRNDASLDRRLLPLCVQVVTDLYVTNHLCNAGNMDRWHNWTPSSEMFEQDSIGAIYYPYLRQSTTSWLAKFGNQK